MEKELRKRENLLVDAGLGVILFAVWSVVRINLYLASSSFIVEEIYKEAKTVGIDGKFLLIFMIIIAAGILVWQLVTRLYIGLSANADGKGKEKSWAYLVFAAILLLTDLQSYYKAFHVDKILAGEGLELDLIPGLCLEAASLYVLMELLIAGVRVKILRKKMEK